MIKPDIFLEKTEQDSLREKLGAGNTISQALAKSAEYLEEGKGWAESFLESMPWLKDIAEAAEEFKVVAFVLKLSKRWLDTAHPYELGAVACTVAYQQAAHSALQQVWRSAIGYGQALKVDKQAARRIRNLPPAEAANLNTFDFETALHHPFVHRANEILRTFLQAANFDEEQQIEAINLTQRGFLSQLRLVLTNDRTAKRFEPFKNVIEMGAAQARAENALLIHAKYQVAQFAARPLFNSEPYALKDVYAEMQCAKLSWREMRQGLNPYEQVPRDLLATTLELIRDKAFNDVIVVQGAAGAGKSSFTLRLCAELWERGFLPLRVRMKRLRLSDSLYASIGKALELEDEDKLDEMPDVDKESLLNRALLRTPYAGDGALAQCVLIFDGWDEMELTDNRAFREQVRELVTELRRQLLDGQERPRIRIVLTGRPTHEIDNKVLNQETPVLSVLPFTPPQLEQFVERMKTAVEQQPLKRDEWKPWAVPPLEVFASVFEDYQQLYAKEFPDPMAVDAGPDQDEWHEGDRDDDEFSPTADAMPELPEPPLRERIAQPELPDKLEILGLPLLSYLTIRVMSQTVAGATDAEARQKALAELLNNPTTLYRRLTDLTCPKAAKSVLAADKDDEIERQLRYSGAALREKLRRTAAAMAVLGREWITKEEWEPRVLDEGEHGEEDFTAAHPLARLMVSFYFRGSISEQSKEHSVEFVHKSFREYLYAEAIVEALKTFGRAAKQGAVERDYWRDFEADRQPEHYKLSRQLSELLAPQWLKREVVSHLGNLLAWEIQRAAKPEADSSAEALRGEPTESLTLKQWETVRDGMAALWAWWTDGAHLRPQARDKGRGDYELRPAYVHELNDTWVRPRAAKLNLKLPIESPAKLDAHLGDALCRLTAWTHSFLVEQAGGLPGWPLPKIERYYGRYLPKEAGEAIARARAELTPAVPITTQSGPGPFQTTVQQGRQQWIVFAPSGELVDTQMSNKFNSRSQAFRLFIARINAVSGRPTGEFPSAISLNNVDWRAVNLDGARLIEASLDGASLHGASLNRAILLFVSVNHASLDGASLDGANLYGAHLYGAHLNHASLNGASLDHASLDGASLDGAGLIGASLDGASLDGARLDRARLDGARLDRARLDDARLDGARLDGARLDGARLDGARLDRARLDGASLDRARLDGASLDGASLVDASLDGTDLSDAKGLTIEQLQEIYWLSEETQFPPGAEFDQLKQDLLQRQRQREKARKQADSDQ